MCQKTGYPLNPQGLERPAGPMGLLMGGKSVTLTHQEKVYSVKDPKGISSRDQMLHKLSLFHAILENNTKAMLPSSGLNSVSCPFQFLLRDKSSHLPPTVPHTSSVCQRRPPLMSPIPLSLRLRGFLPHRLCSCWPFLGVLVRTSQGLEAISAAITSMTSESSQKLLPLCSGCPVHPSSALSTRLQNPGS